MEVVFDEKVRMLLMMKLMMTAAVGLVVLMMTIMTMTMPLTSTFSKFIAITEPPQAQKEQSYLPQTQGKHLGHTQHQPISHSSSDLQPISSIR